MGLITAALGGAGEGLEKGANLAGGLYLKSTLEADRERLAEDAKSQREERNLRLASQLKTAEEAAQPRIIPAGSTVQRQGQQDFQAPAAPEKALTQEQSDLLKAQAEELRARSKYYDRNNGKEPKPTIPKLIVTGKDDQGNPTEWFDENTRASGYKIPGSPAVPPVSHWFSKDEPGKPAIPGGIQWHDPYGRPIASLEMLYTDKGASGAAPAAPTSAPALPDPLGLRSNLKPAPQPKSAPAAPAPARAPIAPAPAPAPAETGAGPAADAAKQKLASATTKLQSYGFKQQRADPQGFAAAQQAVAAAQRDYDSVLAQYQSELGPIGAARFRPR